MAKKSGKEQDCSKLARFGEKWVKDCESCTKSYQGRVDECMGCGKKCKDEPGQELSSCRHSCMANNHEEDKQCSKYESWGPDAMRGCKGCALHFPKKVDQCMECGKECAKLCPAGDFKCYHGEEFGGCHKKCMTKD